MAARTITAEETAVVQELVGKARARDARDRAVRSGDCRSAVPGRGVGRRQRAERHPPGQHERGRERHGQTRADPARQGARDPPRRPAPEEHGHHRGRSGPRPGEVRQARGRDRVADPGDEPVRHAGQHRHLRDQVQGRGDLFPAPVQPEDDNRNGAPDARRAAQAGRARGRPPGGGAAEHPAGQRADGAAAT